MVTDFKKNPFFKACDRDNYNVTFVGFVLPTHTLKVTEGSLASVKFRQTNLQSPWAILE